MDIRSRRPVWRARVARPRGARRTFSLEKTTGGLSDLQFAPAGPRRSRGGWPALFWGLIVLGGCGGGQPLEPTDLGVAPDVVSEVRLPPTEIVSDAETSDPIPTDVSPVDATDVPSDVIPRDVIDEGDVDLAPPGTIPCAGDYDCPTRLQGLGPCERVGCNQRSGVCEALPRLDGSACDDGDACTTGGVCRAGQCMARPIVCDDGNYCTKNLCLSDSGCHHPPREGPCDNLDPCTEGDTCSGGRCVAGSNICPCQDDSDCEILDDLAPCVTGLRCTAEGCRRDEPSAPPPVEGGCGRTMCDPLTGDYLKFLLSDGHPCDNLDACTLHDGCDQGVCRAGSALVCDDGNPCTSNLCLPEAGCVYPRRDSPCDDGDGCTSGDVCTDGLCLPGAENICLDAACRAVQPLRCGARVSASRDDPWATSLLEAYECPARPQRPDAWVPSGLDGPEVAFALQAPMDGTATVALADTDDDVWLMVLEAARRGCDPRACRVALRHGDGSEGRFRITAGHFYYLVVDGPEGAREDFRLKLDCQGEETPPDHADECRPAGTLACATPVFGHTSAGAKQRETDDYGCGSGEAPLRGSEVRYDFVAPVDGTYRARTGNLSAPLEMVVLAPPDHAPLPGPGGCFGGDESRCLVRGRGDLLFTASAGERVQLLLAGEDEHGAGYELWIDCPDHIEARCDDGIDHDGDGLTDCDDPDCLHAPGCGGERCRPIAEITCGDVVRGDTGGNERTSALSDYSCSLFSFSGPEVAYRLRAPPDTDIELDLRTANEALDIFVLAGDGECVAEACLSQGGFVPKSPHERTLFVVVDGHDGASGAYEIEVMCRSATEISCTDGRDNDGDGLTDCADPDCFGTPDCPSCEDLVTGALACGDEIEVSTRAPAATDEISRWACNANDYSGPERVYLFEPPVGGIVRLELEDKTGPLDVLLVRDAGLGCNPASCVAYSPYRIRFRADPGRRYYVVIEGYDGRTGSATLSVICE